MRTQLVFGVLAVLAVPANASETTDRIFGARLQVCNTCHGENGVPKYAPTPIIWGQQENYLVKQMQDFQHGDRANEVMSWMAKTVSEADLGPAAVNFAKKKWPARPAGAASTQPPRG